MLGDAVGYTMGHPNDLEKAKLAALLALQWSHFQ